MQKIMAIWGGRTGLKTRKLKEIQPLALACILVLSGCAGDDSQTSQQTMPNPGMVTTFNSGGCEVWDPVPALTGTQAALDGACVGGHAAGNATVTFFYDGSQKQQSGLSITGNFVNGMPDGNISFSYMPASAYSGQNRSESYGRLAFQDNSVNGPGDVTSEVLDDSGTAVDSTEISGSDFVGTLDNLDPPHNCTVEQQGSGINTDFVGHCTLPSPTSVSPAAGLMGQIIGAANGGGSPSASGPSSDISGISYQYADGTFYLKYPDGNLHLKETGNFAQDGDGGEQFIVYDDVPNAPPRAIAQSAAGDGLEYVQVYNGATQPPTVRADSYVSDNGKAIYLEGAGVYRTDRGQVIAGKWVDGCFNGRFAEDGFPSCAAAAQSLASDEQADANLQEAEQRQAEQQQAWDDAHAQAVWQASNAGSQQMLNNFSNFESQSEQNIETTTQNVQRSELQTQKTIAERSENLETSPTVHVAPPAAENSPPPPAAGMADNGTASADTALPATGCITSFYNPQIYGWWNWKNNCSFSVAVFSQLRNAPYGGENTVIPGNLQSGNTGLSPDEVNAGGGYVYAACPDGYTAIDNATGQLWTRNTASFHCKRS